jgi:hypothetical protein
VTQERIGPDDEEIEVAEIRAEIDETRVEMSGTLNELGDRLDPGNLVNQAKENVRDATIGRVEETARGMSDMVIDTIKQNPIPAAIAGAGLALLWMNRSGGGNGGSDARRRLATDRCDRYGYGYGTARAGGHSGESQEVAPQASEKAGEIRDNVGQAAGQVGENVGQAVGQVRGQLDRFMQASPLAMGAIALGAGAVVGALVPETRREREMLGDASREVSRAVADTVDKATQQAEESLDEAEAAIP